jgi:hypothetical protein
MFVRPEGQVIVIDGKTLRGTGDKSGKATLPLTIWRSFGRLR